MGGTLKRSMQSIMNFNPCNVGFINVSYRKGDFCQKCARGSLVSVKVYIGDLVQIHYMVQKEIMI